MSGSLLHGMNPAVKLIVFLSVIQMASVSTGALTFALFAALFAAVSIQAGLRADAILKKLKPFILILIFTFLLNILFGSDASYAGSVTVRFALVILFSILLTLTTEPKMLVSAILAPARGEHGKNLKIIFMVALEFIPVFIDRVKETAAEIKAMPEFSTGTYRALFKPELYLRPLMNGLMESSAEVAEKVSAGEYDTPPLSKPQMWEIALGTATVIMAVIYAA